MSATSATDGWASYADGAGSHLVSVVILVHNGRKYLFECAESVEAQDYTPVEVIVIDNGSSDAAVNDLRKQRPHWTFVEHARNVGFAAGMNSGLSVASGDYLLALNQDVYLDPAFVGSCVAEMNAQVDAGALGTQEYAWRLGHRSDELRVPGPAYFLRHRFQGIALPLASQASRTEYAFGVNGSFPFLRRQALQELTERDGHIYDPMFFSGWEDQDLWWRLQLLGWRCYATTATKAWHVGSSYADEVTSFMGKPAQYQRWVMRNRWLVILKNVPAVLLSFYLPAWVLLEVLLPFYLLWKRPSAVAAWALGWCDIVRQARDIWCRRRRIQGSRRIDARLIIGWFRAI